MAGPKKKKRRRSRHGKDPQRAQIVARREEARRRAREERRLAAIAEAKRERRRKALRRAAFWAFAGVGVATVALLVFRPAPEVEGVLIPDEIEARVLDVGETFDYGTAAPTSGPYLDAEPACGVFATEIDAEAAVTALYYGAVVVWHTPDLAPSEVSALNALATDSETHVVVSPNPDLDGPIVATAWNRTMSYETTDGVAEFIETYRKRGPDSADCPVS